MNEAEVFETETKLKDNKLFVSSFPFHIRKSITEYTKTVQINRLLRSGALVKTSKRRHLGHFQTMLKNLDFAFDVVPPLKSSIIVYRGIEGTDFYPDDLGFVSTATDLSFSPLKFVGDTCCFLKIHVPLGSKVLRIPGEIGHFSDEDEVLLDRDATFVRTGEPDVEFQGRRMISLEYIPKKRKHVKNENQYARYTLRLGINKDCDLSILKKYTINQLDDFENIIRMAKDNSCIKNILKIISKSYTVTKEDLEKTINLFDLDSLQYLYNIYPNLRIFLIDSILNKTRKFDPNILKMLFKLYLDENKITIEMIKYIITHRKSISVKDFERLQSIINLNFSTIPRYFQFELAIAGFVNVQDIAFPTTSTLSGEKGVASPNSPKVAHSSPNSPKVAHSFSRKKHS